MNESINSLSVSQLAAATRSTRVMVKLPGCIQLSQESCQVYAELVEWDDALNIIAVLAVPEEA